MRKAVVYAHGNRAGVLTEVSPKEYKFNYYDDYNGQAISLTMPVGQKEFSFNGFPPFFEGLLPEGVMLEGLLRISKIDHNDYFSQLMATGADLVGAVTVEPMEDE
ncbi:HipA N-terminal domain-containing protein [Flagellimonas baculiformis]|uniref:HipA N-terminal domain-containing protein n=1 Tax=Flagellimonas baculiformis TaxID=3067310 RepID=UPI00296E62BE|nr:HipA N-terminal domain-containing protein [Muricauda sp. D6]